MAGVDDGEAGTGSRAELDRVSFDAGVLVVKLSGEIDLSSADSLRPAVDQLIAAAPRTVVFDVGDLTFMDSSGIALLLSVAERIDTVQVRNPSAVIGRLIELSGLGDTLRVVP